MANLPPNSDSLAIHLSDRSLTPILSSSQRPASSYSAQTQAEALSSLTQTAITAFDIASRLDLGVPQRIMIESHSAGPMILHSFITPQSMQRPRSGRTTSGESAREIIEQAQEDMRPLTATTEAEDDHEGRDDALVNGVGHSKPVEDDDEEVEDAARSSPLLVASVITPSSTEAGDARRAAARLERTGREFQREWMKEQEDAKATVALEDEGDG